MKTNNVDFGKSFKLKVKLYNTVYTCHSLDDTGRCKVTWIEDGEEGSTSYKASTIAEYIKDGDWIVLPSENTDNSHNTENTSEDNLLDEIKAFTATSNHSVFIHEGIFEVYQAGMTEFPYKCKDDETLRSVMQALSVLDNVSVNGGMDE